MKKLLELRQQKAALKTQMRSMLDKADTEKRNLNEEEGKKFDELWSSPHNVDTLLSEVLFFKLLRAETATRTVTTPTIVIALNVIKYHGTHIITTD